MNDFRNLVHSVTTMLCEESERESVKVDAEMRKYGYKEPQPGADGHVTFTAETNEHDQMLVDVPGGEWHHLVKGVVNKVGKMNDGSLERYFEQAGVKPLAVGSKPNTTKKIYTIEASPEVLDNFERFLAYVQWCSSVGHSTHAAMSIDGDGADRFKVLSPSVKDKYNKETVASFDSGRFEIQNK